MLSRAIRKFMAGATSDKRMGRGSKGDEPAALDGLLADPPPIDPSISHAIALLLQSLATQMAQKAYATGVENGNEIPAKAAEPEASIRKARPKKLPKPVPKDEVDAIRRVINTRAITGLRNRVMLDIMYRAGLRVSEVCDLGPRDVEIHDDGGVIHVIQGKGSKDRTVYFDTAVIGPELEAWRNERKRLGLGSSPYLFCTIRETHTSKGTGHKGERVSPRYLQQWVKRMAKRAGVDPSHITPHKFRHSFATETYEETSDIVLVQEQLGHDNLDTTMVYTKIADATRKRKMQARQDPLA